MRLIVKTLLLSIFASALLAICVSAQSEPRFNALDTGDPHYTEYQYNLCRGALADYNRFHADKTRLDRVRISTNPDQREAWVVNYAVTARLREVWRDKYQANCVGDVRFDGTYDAPKNAEAAVINKYEREQNKRKSPGNNNRTAISEGET